MLFQSLGFIEILNKNLKKCEAFLEIVSWRFVLTLRWPFEHETNSTSRTHLKRCQIFNSEYCVRILQCCMFNNNSHFLYVSVGFRLIYIYLTTNKIPVRTLTGRQWMQYYRTKERLCVSQISVIILPAT